MRREVAFVCVPSVVGVPAIAGVLAIFSIHAIVVGVFAVAGIPAVDGVLRKIFYGRFFNKKYVHTCESIYYVMYHSGVT
jgi:hypothetical protein